MNIYSYFHQSSRLFPDQTALFVNGQHFTYTELEDKATMVAALLKGCHGQFAGLLAHRSITAFSGVLGILKSGKAYIPLNPKFPAERNATMIRLAGLDTIVVDPIYIPLLKEIIAHCHTKFNLIFPFTAENELDRTGLEGNRIICFDPKIKPDADFVEADDKQYAYMLFTSGSTGKPKGVPISHGNVACYVENLNALNDFGPDDRFTNTFDLTFDLSVHDMMVCWRNGAGLYCLPDESLMAPSKFINTHQITLWFSVPSLAAAMHRLRLLKPGAFPSLRYSLFCGEPLSETLAEAFQLAAPNSVLKNIYGPTEATIGITEYVCQFGDPKEIKSLNGFVSIGKVFSQNAFKLVDENNHEVPPGEVGELLLSGKQVAEKYWNDPEKTGESFIKMGDDETIWYKTGDLVKADKEGDLYFCDRKDFQVKIQGYRVELKEIDFVIGEFLQHQDVVTLAAAHQNQTTLVSFICDPNASIQHDEESKLALTSDIMKHCKTKLPAYMIPQRIIFVKEFPLNQNQKIDRKKLLADYSNLT